MLLTGEHPTFESTEGVGLWDVLVEVKGVC